MPAGGKPFGPTINARGRGLGEVPLWPIVGPVVLVSRCWLGSAAGGPFCEGGFVGPVDWVGIPHTRDDWQRILDSTRGVGALEA